MVAIFLGLRLRSVLGKRTGNEPPPGTYRGGPAPGQGPVPSQRQLPDNVVDIEPNRRPTAAPPGSLAARLDLIRANDPTFSENGFESGAKAAFGIIVDAFAHDDEDSLRPLLSPEVFANFSSAIQARKAAGELCENKLVKVDSTDISDAQMDGSHARITVRYISEQIIVIKNAAGEVVEGDPDRVVEITDIWTFSRDTRSHDPNWLLVATSSPDA